MNSSDKSLLQCYNASCGQKYTESSNRDDSCVYHSGRPVFHDAYKSWSCCAKKTTDFTEFLGIPGCTKGRHSNTKPVELAKPDKNDDKMETLVQEILNKPINTKDPVERPSENIPLKLLITKISPCLHKQLEQLSLEDPAEKSSGDAIDLTNVPLGTSCKNSGCRKSFQGPESNQEKCLFHPGVPIFHEGMKYWSCCQRKTSDFEMFLAQEGCESGNHLWFKLKDEGDTVKASSTSCRFDWHQTTNNVVLTIYAKTPFPDKCEVKANPVKLSVNVTFGGHDEKLFIRDFILFSIIDVDNSFVEYSSSKVEINMKKADKSSWKRLTFTQ